jgi:hypothetical protein
MTDTKSLIEADAHVPMTAEELAEVEVNAARQMRLYLEFYEAFPTARNFDMAVERMRFYQDCWMNGRKRP